METEGGGRGSALAEMERGGRGRGGARGRGRGRGGGGGRGRRVVRLPQRRRFILKGQQVIYASITLAVEIFLLTRRDPTSLRKLSKMLVPWSSILSVWAAFAKYKRRGEDEGPLQHRGPYLYFEDEGGRVWHSPTAWEVLGLLFALLHMASSLFSWLRAINGWEFGTAFSSHPMAFASLLLWVSLLDICCP